MNPRPLVGTVRCFRQVSRATRSGQRASTRSPQGLNDPNTVAPGPRSDRTELVVRVIKTLADLFKNSRY
jgi:hypothetical protein